jgi:hypothetical protein
MNDCAGFDRPLLVILDMGRTFLGGKHKPSRGPVKAGWGASLES